MKICDQKDDTKGLKMDPSLSALDGEAIDTSQVAPSIPEIEKQSNSFAEYVNIKSPSVPQLVKE